MSIEVMTAVWDSSRAYGGDLLIILAIANYADIHGRAYPSVKTLAQRGRMTERNAQYCLKKLEGMGELKIERNAGPHGTHVFQILLEGANFSGCKVFTHQHKRVNRKEINGGGEKISGEKIAGVQSFRGEMGFAGGVKPISPEPSLDPSVKDIPPVSTKVETSPTGDDRRGKRLPNDWHPTAEDLAWAEAKGYTRTLDLTDETEEFCKYWWSQPTKATKLDWSMTWQNRMRRQAAQAKPRRQTAGPQRRTDEEDARYKRIWDEVMSAEEPRTNR